MYYNSIKVIIENWCQAQDGDLTALRHDRAIGTPKGDEEAFQMVLDDYMRVFGVSESFMRTWKLRVRKANITVEYLSDIENNRHLITDIEILDKQIAEISKLQGGTVSLRKIIAKLKKNGATIDMNSDTLEMVENMIRDGIE